MAFSTISSTNNTNISTIKLSNFCLSEIELIPGLPNDIALECLLKIPITSHPTLRLVSHHWKSTLSHPHFFSLRRLAAAAEHLLFLIQPVSPPPPPPLPQRNKAVSDLEESDSKENGDSQSPLLYNLSIYNSTHQQWRNLANINVPTFAQCVAVPSLAKVVVLGGWDPATLEPVPRVLVIDLPTGTWKEGSPMPTARSFFAGAAVGGTVCVAGGHDGRKNALRTAEIYDVEADQWRRLPDMAEERDESHGLILGDGNESKFWVISGYGTESQGRFRSDCEIYDPETNTWSRVEEVWPYTGYSPKSTAVAAESRRQRRWLSVINGEAREFDFEGKEWGAVNLGRIPESVIGSTSISVVDMGDDRIMVMGNGERCKEEGCGGEGVFMVEKICEEGEKKGEINWRWEHVHAPMRFLGSPFSTSQILI